MARLLFFSKFEMEITLLRIFTYTTNEMHILFINTTAGNMLKENFKPRMEFYNRVLRDLLQAF